MHFGFPAAVNPWLTFGVQAVTGITTVIIAGLVAWITRRNSQIAREKLRLDLYERRYAIYKQTVMFNMNLVLWTGDEAQTERSLSFFELSAEARFLFPPQSGVTAFLNEMHEHASFIVRFKSTFDACAGMPEEQVRLAKERSEHVGWLTTSMPELAKRMGPYLNFYSI
jgi:hypothetical protein